jgi:hypothetical protein
MAMRSSMSGTMLDLLPNYVQRRRSVESLTRPLKRDAL